MNANGQERVLLFHFKEGPQLAAIRTMLFIAQIPGRLVSKEEYSVPLEMLAMDEEVPHTALCNTQELDGQMIVFAGLKEDKLESLLTLLKSNPACGQIPYKAILTETNQKWNALMLFNELQKEHAAMHSNVKH